MFCVYVYAEEIRRSCLRIPGCAEASIALGISTVFWFPIFITEIEIKFRKLERTNKVSRITQHQKNKIIHKIWRVVSLFWGV